VPGPPFLNADLARSEFDPDLVDRLERGLVAADGVGDAVAAFCEKRPGGAGMRAINAWLEEDAALPGRLSDLLGPLAVVPEWVEWDRLERGSVAYWRTGLWVALTLNCASLASGYRSGIGNKPLVMTGRLVHMARRRQQETARWILAAAAPGGLRRDQPGFKETVRVRIVHAHVRRRLLASGKWHTEKWGVPINVTHSAWTIAGEFSTVPVRAMRDVGFHFSQSERDDIQHLWRYIGWLMGVPDDLLAHDEQRALELDGIRAVADAPPDEDSHALVTALIENGTPPELLMPGALVRVFGALVEPTLYGFTRRWAGDAVADELRLPDTPLKYLGTLIRPTIWASETIRRAGILGSDSDRAAATVKHLSGLLDRDRAPRGVVSVDDAVAAAA
jgi:hypothetical protein